MRIVLLFLLILLGTANVRASEDQQAPDQAEIERAIENWNAAWKIKDPKLAAQDYSDSADWTNAFGMSRVGRVEIEKLLTEVFALPFVMAGDSETVAQDIRFIKPDLALVITRVQRKGQRNPTGQEIGQRRTSHLRVFAQTDGNWQIISHLISDARETQQAAH
ncbi:hypothetical protein CSC74_12970 [Pseudoxanthomonas yeongjuensis]|uniref:SgcJ/EcaC family oxidoreductase n=1 Tax=Pseudoxanthomonas yeongjuensis TaxID=377616 RepID=UPI001390A684|nr:SgcJ/EcaC family oxidoreductase [Pseudoxanthomonas yeongjuensis]KAF1715482.1 hypothetical protein CSC74_12970 [Pseudoxanthomonas yeongjuensis]